MTRLFVITDNETSHLVRNPNLPCQSHGPFVFYKEQADRMLNERADITIWEMTTVKTQKTIA